jgi:hypothetical protein
MKNFVNLKHSIIIFILIVPYFVFADSWLQTSWSGGDGYFQWQDPTGYYEGNNVNGWRKPGSLTLFAPDFEHFYSIGKMVEAMGVYSLYSDNLRRYFAGVDDITSSGNAKVCISSNFGGTWKSSIIDTGSVSKVTSIFLPSFEEEIFVGIEKTNSPKIYKSIFMGDSGWQYMPNPLSGNSVSNILELSNGNLYASTVSSANNKGKIWEGFHGNNWAPLDTNPSSYGVKPAGILEFIMTEEMSWFVSTYFLNGGNNVGKIFRSYVLGEWEECFPLPDTLCKPFAMGIRNDTLGNYGIIYVGVKINGGMGKIFLSMDEGDSWDTCGALEGAKTIKDIIVDRDGTVYATSYVSEGMDYVVKVFRSSDMGLTWESTSALGGIYTNEPTSFHQTDRGFLLVGTENEAEIFKSAYTDTGYLVSSVYDVGTGNGSSEFGNMWWIANLNNQHLKIRVRTDTDSAMVGAFQWYQCDSVENGQDISELSSVDDTERYIQYRIDFWTDSIDFSPELKEIKIEFSIDTFPPILDTAYACDSNNIQGGIDYDDYVIMVFDDSTKQPTIDPDTIDAVLKLANGHSWLDSMTNCKAEWLSPETLKIWWPGLDTLCDTLPSVSVGDMIYPDSLTITDRWGNGCYNPVLLTGSFGPGGVALENKDSKSMQGVMVYPSLTRKNVMVKFAVERNSGVKISLFDITGRVVGKILDKEYSKGVHSFDCNCQNLPDGVYFIKTEINEKNYIKKIIIVK